MRVSVTRKKVKFMPDSSRVVARYFMNGDQRTQKMVSRIIEMDEKQVNVALEHTLREFASRHRNISLVFFKHCAKIQGIIEGMQIDYAGLSDERKMLIGSYCTMEYSIESAAFFNPSIVEDFDQLYLEKERGGLLSLSVPLEKDIFRPSFSEEEYWIRIMISR